MKAILSWCFFPDPPLSKFLDNRRFTRPSLIQKGGAKGVGYDISIPVTHVPGLHMHKGGACILCLSEDFNRGRSRKWECDKIIFISTHQKNMITKCNLCPKSKNFCRQDENKKNYDYCLSSEKMLSKLNIKD
jgi:hypothetical protein